MVVLSQVAVPDRKLPEKEAVGTLISPKDPRIPKKANGEGVAVVALVKSPVPKFTGPDTPV
jgi:hypothetical protein